MAVSYIDVDEVNKAIAHGERMVRFRDGRTVEYRSVAELIQARDDILRQISKDAPSPRRRHTYLSHGGRGF